MEKVFIKFDKDPQYTMKESLRTLRTNIQFCGDDVRTILFTSCIPDEGKSSVVLNLARSISESGKNVLLIDTDMRKSVLLRTLHARGENNKEIFGLSHYLSGQKNIEEVFYSTDVPGFFVVFAGPSVPNPTEILEKNYMKELIDLGRSYFDYVLVDCAPLGAAIDAAVVAKYCDGAVLVVEQGVVNFRMLLDSKKQLEASGIRILGSVINKVKMKKSNYYYKKYYGGYGNYYGGSEDDHDKHFSGNKDK
ncbi:MAG: CpsD/CapB family tyrosine-protein kinase [Lachnospiraceae bacterium]|nr:CpsD/CapB family tyrosine-protein kinase [Lachnospiraceae bacterium]